MKNKEKTDKFTSIFCSIINNSLKKADYRWTYLCQMYPLVVASGGQEWYYIMSHLQSDVRSAWYLQSGMSRSDVPPIEASGDQDWHNVKSGSHLQSEVRFAWHVQSHIPMSDVPPTRGTWWPSVVLHQVSLTFTVGHTEVRCTPLVEASGGQEWYYVRSAWHLQSDVMSAWHLQSGIPRSDLSNKLQCRRMSTVLKWIWVHEQLTRKSL